MPNKESIRALGRYSMRWTPASWNTNDDNVIVRIERHGFNSYAGNTRFNSVADDLLHTQDFGVLIKSLPKKWGSFTLGMKISGCCLRYSYMAVVPHLGAPTIKKSGFLDMIFIVRRLTPGSKSPEAIYIHGR